jgi:CheY-like chemotaxis protein
VEAVVELLLIADDDPEVREMIEFMVRSHLDVRVEGAEDGAQVMAKLAVTPARVLLLDMQMPVMDGAATLAAIRRDDALRDAYVVAMSAAASLEHAARASGCDSFLRKPFGVDALLAAIGPRLGGAAPPG